MGIRKREVSKRQKKNSLPHRAHILRIRTLYGKLREVELDVIIDLSAQS